MSDYGRIAQDTSLSPRKRFLAADLARSHAFSEGDDDQARFYASLMVSLAKGCDLTDSTILTALEKAYITLAPVDLHAYLVAMEWHRPPRKRFYAPRMQVLKPVADAITAMLIKDEFDLELVSMPPRVGKTTLGTFALSWYASIRPDDPILAVSYAEKILKMFHTGVLELMTDPQYNYREIFPQVAIVDVSMKDLTIDLRNDGRSAIRKYKTLTFRPIEGSLTGATEARSLLYVDDLVRDIEEALNKNRLDALYDKFISNTQSRKREGCKELHIGTRWSLHDPLSRIERLHQDNPRFKSIKLPALDPETDTSNFEYKYDLGFSTEYYRQMREVYRDNGDEVSWECIYQQNPIERSGLLFPYDALQWVYAMPDMKKEPPDDVFAFVDVAFGGKDYLAVPIAAQWGEEPPYIVDVVYMQGDYKVTQPVVVAKLMEHGVRRVVFEANAGGDFYAREVNEQLKAQGYHCHVMSRRTPSNKSKEARIVQYSPDILQFRYWHPSQASDIYKKFLRDLTSYTVYGKNEHDDAPDALAGLASIMKSNTSAKVRLLDRTHI